MAMPKVTSSVVLAIVAGLAMVSLAAATTGTATFYTPPYTPSKCHGFEDDGTMIAAGSEILWRGGSPCDQRYVVRCTGATNDGVPHPCTYGPERVTVRIVDLCPPPPPRDAVERTIYLSQEAFAVIAAIPDAGKINIEYTRI